MGYSRTFGSYFPNVLINPGNHKDVDDNSLEIINKYKSYMQSNNRAKAYELYSNNKEILDPCIITADYLNYLEEEVLNTGMAALGKQSTIVSDEDPIVNQLEGSYWLREY